MKLDKIKFARVVTYLTRYCDANIRSEDMVELDDLINIEVPAQDIPRVSQEAVNELLKQLNSHDGFIPAIKAYRTLTGAGLKESKEAIERYRSIPNFPKKEPATLGDILNRAKP